MSNEEIAKRFGDDLYDSRHLITRAGFRKTILIAIEKSNGREIGEMCDYCEQPTTLIRLCNGFRIATCKDHEELAIITPHPASSLQTVSDRKDPGKSHEGGTIISPAQKTG